MPRGPLEQVPAVPTLNQDVLIALLHHAFEKPDREHLGEPQRPREVYATLLSASLVCRSWREAAQRLIWTHVRITRVNSDVRFVQSKARGRFRTRALLIDVELAPAEAEGSLCIFEVLLIRLTIEACEGLSAVWLGGGVVVRPETLGLASLAGEYSLVSSGLAILNQRKRYQEAWFRSRIENLRPPVRRHTSHASRFRLDVGEVAPGHPSTASPPAGESIHPEKSKNRRKIVAGVRDRPSIPRGLQARTPDALEVLPAGLPAAPGLRQIRKVHWTQSFTFNPLLADPHVPLPPTRAILQRDPGPRRTSTAVSPPARVLRRTQSLRQKVLLTRRQQVVPGQLHQPAPPSHRRSVRGVVGFRHCAGARSRLDRAQHGYIQRHS